MCAAMPRAARRPPNSVYSVNLVFLDLLSSRLWFTPLGSDNSHFFKWLFTKMAVSMVCDPESEQELAESHLMLKNAWLCFRISFSFVCNNHSPLIPIRSEVSFRSSMQFCFKQLYRLCERRFVRTFALQKEFSHLEAVHDGSGKEMVWVPKI